MLSLSFNKVKGCVLGIWYIMVIYVVAAKGHSAVVVKMLNA